MKSKTKQIIIVIVMAGMLTLAGCGAPQNEEADANAKDLEQDTGQDFDNVTVGSSYQFEVKMTEKNHMSLVKEQPPFQMDNSLERENLIRRYQYLNDENNVHHVYLMSNDGKVVSYFVAQGKVSSVNSKLTNDKQIVAIDKCIYEEEYERENNLDGRDIHTEDESNCFKTVESPQMDGSYGTNGNAIFFFTTSGDYVEWNGKYLVSEEPRNIQTTISLEQQVDEDGDDASGNNTNSTDG